MRILFVVGSCLKSNSSANLCHMAYIRGAIALGHEVEIISVSEKDVPVDKGINLPESIEWHCFDSALYTRISYRRSHKDLESSSVASGSANISKGTIDSSPKKSFVRKMKDRYVDSMGIYGFDLPWIKKVSKYKDKKKFDLVISLAWPPASHEATRRLIESGRVKKDCWCQIWEDPWYLDLWMDKDQTKYDEETKLLRAADKIMYVSPITLKYQKETFKECADKMFWVPLPFYYAVEETNEREKNEHLLFGYYGDYHPHIRNLLPFYEAADKTGIDVNIYGNPSDLFNSTSRISVRSRVGLDILKEVEGKTDVMVFVCNVKGGQIPGKLYQYSSTKKWILFILDGTETEMEQIQAYYKQFKRYVFCQNNVNDITRAIELIKSRDIEDVNNEPVAQFAPEKIFQNIADYCLD